jgi:hypothetical protein
MSSRPGGTGLAELSVQVTHRFAAFRRRTIQGRNRMKLRMKFTKTLLVSALLTLSGAAFAQGAGGGGGNSGGGSSGGGGAGMATGNDTGANKAGQNATSSSGMSHSQMQHHSTKGKKKQMNDTTNMPGADASSDTKGQ